MTQDEVIALAEKCKLAVLIHSQWTHEIKEFTVVDYVVEGDLGSLMQFADLVANAEREACADLCKEMYLSGDMDTGLAEEAILARGDGITLTTIRHPKGKPALGDLNPESLETMEIDVPDQKLVAWYDPTNGVVSTDKDSPLFTPLGQLLPLYTQSGQEPVAWMVYTQEGQYAFVTDDPAIIHPSQRALPLYATPQRTWVGLTDEEVELYWDWEDFQTGAGRSTIFEMVRNIETKLKEKNS